MAKNERFKSIYSQGVATITEILVDTRTGINYIWHMSGYAGGLTPLLDKDGKPVISEEYIENNIGLTVQKK